MYHGAFPLHFMTTSPAIFTATLPPLLPFTGVLPFTGIFFPRPPLSSSRSSMISSSSSLLAAGCLGASCFALRALLAGTTSSTLEAMCLRILAVAFSGMWAVLHEQWWWVVVVCGRPVLMWPGTVTSSHGRWQKVVQMNHNVSGKEWTNGPVG